MGNFGLRRQAERDAALEKDRTLIHPAKALSSLRFASAVQMCQSRSFALPVSVVASRCAPFRFPCLRANLHPEHMGATEVEVGRRIGHRTA